MRQEWEPEELVASWTLVDADWALVANTPQNVRAITLIIERARLDEHWGKAPSAAVEALQLVT